MEARFQLLCGRVSLLKKEGAKNNEQAANDENTEEVLTAEALAWQDGVLRQYGLKARGLWRPRFIRKPARSPDPYVG